MTPRSTSRVELHAIRPARRAPSSASNVRWDCRNAPRRRRRSTTSPSGAGWTRDDHRSRQIDGALEVAARYEDVVVSRLTAWFRGEQQAVNILAWGITPDDHERLQALAGDVEAVAEELAERAIVSALAHPSTPSSAAAAAPPPPPPSALPDLGDAQRLPRARAQLARRGGHRDARRDGRRRRGRHAGVDVGRRRVDGGLRDVARVPRPGRRRRRRGARRARQRAEVDACREALPPARRPRRERRRGARPGGDLHHGPAADEGGRRALQPTGPACARTTRGRCCGPGSRGRARRRRDGAVEAAAGRRILRRRPLPAGEALPRAELALAVEQVAAVTPGSATSRRPPARCSRLPGGDPVRAGCRLLGLKKAKLARRDGEPLRSAR